MQNRWANTVSSKHDVALIRKNRRVQIAKLLQYLNCFCGFAENRTKYSECVNSCKGEKLDVMPDHHMSTAFVREALILKACLRCPMCPIGDEIQMIIKSAEPDNFGKTCWKLSVTGDMARCYNWTVQARKINLFVILDKRPVRQFLCTPCLARTSSSQCHQRLLQVPTAV